MNKVVDEVEKDFVALGHKVVAGIKSAVAAVEGAFFTEADLALAFVKQNEPLLTKTLNLAESIAVGAPLSTIFPEIEDEYNTFVGEGGFEHLLDETKSLLHTFVSSVKTDITNDLAKV